MMSSMPRSSAACATSTVKSTKASCLRTKALATSDASGGPLSCSKVRKPKGAAPASSLPRATAKEVHGVAMMAAQ